MAALCAWIGCVFAACSATPDSFTRFDPVRLRVTASAAVHRRSFLALAASLLALPGCERAPAALPAGGFGTDDLARGHALRERLAQGLDLRPDVRQRTRVLIAGGGIAGLAAARALRLAGVPDVALLELQDSAGGNSRAGQLGGLACPLGAHYLPVPGDGAPEVQDLLEELGLRRREAGRWRHGGDGGRHLVHSPQERLYLHGHWQEGLLPLQGVGAGTLAQYRRFGARVAQLARTAPFAMPTLGTWRAGQGLHPEIAALDAVTFDAWLAHEGLDDAWLRWYLDYCCRDDYGAGSARVSAWAGIHYFASRHGFAAPGEEGDVQDHGVLAWPEGNGWLAQRLAAPLQAAAQLHTGRAVLRIDEGADGVQLDALDLASGRVERWQAERCVVALPTFIAARVLGAGAPDVVHQAARRLPRAPWLVANLHLSRPLQDVPGAAPSWDNVIHADPVPGGLGYVDAGHQRLAGGALLAAPTVLTYYQALGDVPGARAALATQDWTHWAAPMLQSLSAAHPDLPDVATRLELTRHGHAMAIPVPGTQAFLSQIGLQSNKNKGLQLSNGERARVLPVPATARLVFAHADWSGYSVFEEAFTRGHAAGLWAA
ncbi:Monoamine oxidase [Oryzisolibacter propanilivorax]|uniref:Monoamine oxidase n=1 Tax=Oryzisolibacter propanilivorax TaxID=1527607 RepID=A0A1G9QPX5_9BURK|nr:Monoamine oxidase [Oryzisolibacter propanilivorax]